MLKSYFEKIYKDGEKDKEQKLKDVLSNLPKDKTFLDIGCWDGKKTLMWSKSIKAKEVTSIEIDKKAAQKAKKNKVKVYIADINKKWPLQANSVDCVFSNLVIEHLTDVDNFISESFRVLRKGGYTVVCTNNLASWHNVFSLLFGWAPFDLTNSTPKAWSIGNPLVIHKNESSLFGKSYCHKCIYTPKWLREWYEIYKFQFVKIVGAGYYPLPSFIGNIDKTHAAFMILVFQKL